MRHLPWIPRPAGWIAAALLPTTLLAAACGPDRPERDRTVLRRGGDLIGGGSSLRVTDTIPSDVILAGGEIEFEGSTGGDFLGAGGRQRIAGRVGGSARAAGGDVVLAGPVERNATLAGGRVELTPDAAVGGNAYLAGGSVQVRGSVGSVLQATAGDILLDGEFGGDVHVRGDRLRVGAGTTIAGDLRYQVPAAAVSIDPAAAIEGEAVHVPPPTRTTRRVLGWLWRLGFLVAGAVAVALFPGASAAAGETLGRRVPASAGLGLLWVLALPVVAGLVALTVVGLPLALILLAVYLIALYLARVVVGVWIGRRILGERAGSGRGGLVLSFLIGGVILLIAGAIPWIGTLVTVLATIAGVGAAVALAVLDRWRPAPAPAAPAPGG